jgi:thiol-disulfide isomerase/thioredoxin
MKKYLIPGIAALLVLVTGCNRSGVIDATSTASTAASPAAAGSSAHKSSTPARIAHGKEVNIQDFVVAGKTTIFDFTSEYCPPCRAIAPLLHKLHADRADVVVVEVDLNRPGVQGIDWASPLAKQYQMNSIPAFKVYGPNGRLQAEGDDAYQLVRNMLR